MLVSDMITISRWFIYVISIVLLIKAINTNNIEALKRDRLIGVVFIIYLLALNFFLPQYFNIDIGLELLLFMAFELVDSIILIIGIVANSVKIKKLKTKTENENVKQTSKSKFEKYYAAIIIAIPIVFICVAFLQEMIVLNKCDLVITYNYQNGIVISKDTRYAIGKNYCEEITIGKEFSKRKGYNSYCIQCHIEKNDQNELIFESNDSIEEFDKNVVEKIYNDKSYKESKNISTSDEKEHKAYVNKIKGTDYYIIEHTLGSSVVGEAIYLGDTYIDDIYGYGDIESVIIYTK